MKKVQTNDGSVTFYSEEFGETYHSQSGAIEEAFKKYAEVCELHQGMRVLDVCFGLGYNTLAAIHIVKELDIVGLENDKKVLETIQKINVSDDLKEDFEKVKEAAKNLNYDDGQTKIKILIGDARKTIKVAEGDFDAVFFDPFSPKKCPELWTEEFFIEVYRKMKKGGVLATYSCARTVRENMKKAGFEVRDGPRVGRRGPGTVGLKP